jgi:hypothetical protein
MSQVDHWESAVLPGDNWRYQVPNQQPSSAWIQSNFDDSNWSIGPSGFGYGDNDDATIIPTTLSVYLRKAFDIVDINDIESAVLDMDYDDGFVAYLNGVEIARSLVSGNPPLYNQASDGDHEALLYNGLDPERFSLDKNLLAQGTNVLAVEIHNRDITSSDMTAIPVLSVGILSSNYNYRSVPSWFDSPVSEVVFSSSNLPIVIINTLNNAEIPNEPKIPATMKIIDNGMSVRNNVADQSNPASLNYDGSIQIEVRGSSSSIIPKKQYALTTYSSAFEKVNVSLLGLPDENDWILNGLAFDPSLLRDFISYRLSNQIGEYASRGRYCEMVLNGEYRGVYVLQEKLKADKNRINVEKIEPIDVSGNQLTGGYIIKSDKTEGNDVAAWFMSNHLGWGANFVHEFPDAEAIDPAQHAFIEGQFRLLENAAESDDFSIETGFPSVIDMPSFVDFMILNEFASNVDGYQFSTFFHKDRMGKLRAGPIWDFNLTMGNDLIQWGLDRSHTDVWQFDNGDNVGAAFWKDLFDNSVFKCYFRKRWYELTAPNMPLHSDQVNILIDETVNVLAEAVVREESKWGTIGDHAGHISDLKDWIETRITWINEQLGPVTNCFGQSVPQLVITKIHYHPKTADGLSEDELEFVEILNRSEDHIDLKGMYFGKTGFVYQFDESASLEPYQRIFLANDATTFKEAYGFEPFGEFTRNLANSGQHLLLLNGYGNTIDEVAFDDDVPWPVEADGDGYFLEVINANLDNNDPLNWRAVKISKGALLSPKVVNVYPNPAIDKVTLSGELLMEEIQVLDLQGKLLRAYAPGQRTFEIPVADLNTGMYFLKIRGENELTIRKIVVR